MGLLDQILLAIICKRTYQITVAWNTRPVEFPIDPLCDFPNFRIPSYDHVCKRIETTVEGEKGEFFGIICKLSGLPDGNGVLKAGEWIHCGEVKDGVF